jgi:plasmid maintenance system antidote protein VapI
VAFHLHRLKLVGRPLWQAGYDRNTAADIAAARTALSDPSLSKLAACLGTQVHELTRPLTVGELREWSFYRRAVSNPQHVWAAACAAWRAAGLSDKQAAMVMGYAAPTVTRALAHPSRSILSFDRALRLTTALSITEGPEALLPLQQSVTAERSVD